MKAVIIFTGGGPVLFLTSYDSFKHPEFLAKLKGGEVSANLLLMKYPSIRSSRNMGNILMS